jgi:hypothetical protein
MSGIEFLQKPFLPKMLVDLIQRISQRDDTGATDPASAGAASG